MSEHSLETDANALLRFLHDEAEGAADVEVDIEPFLEEARWSDDHIADVRAYLEDAGKLYALPEADSLDAPGNPFALTEKGVDYVARLKF